MKYVKKRTYRPKTSMSKVPKSVKKYVAKAIDRNIEDRKVIFALPTEFGSVGTTWIEKDLCSAIATGDGYGTRSGRAIKVKNIEVHGTVAQGSNGTLTDDQYNVMRFVCGAFTGTASTPLASAGVGLNMPITKTENCRNFLKQVYTDRYIPLNVTSTEKGGGDGYTPEVKNFNYKKRFKTPYTIKWGGDDASYPANRLFVSMLSDSSAVVHPGFVAGWITVTYEDA